MKSNRFGILIALSLVFAVKASAVTRFDVQHDHLLGSCKGQLVFNETTIEYSTEKAEHSRTWKYEDIQQLEVLPGQISVLTYDVSKIQLGSDRSFNFKVLSGEVSDQLRQDLESKLSRPLVSSIVPERAGARYAIPVRHRRFLSGSQGVLELAEEYIIYRAGKPKESQIWRYDQLLSVGTTGPFQLRLGALQKTGGEYGDEKNYVFDLKRRLKPEEYDFLWERVNGRKLRASP